MHTASLGLRCSAAGPLRAALGFGLGALVLLVVAPATLSQFRLDLLAQSAPGRIAALLAAAGFDAVEAAQTFQQLGVDQESAAVGMTAIYPYASVDRAAEPLYDPAASRAALADAYGAASTAVEPHGLRLIDKWTRMVNGPAIEVPVPTR